MFRKLCSAKLNARVFCLQKHAHRFAGCGVSGELRESATRTVSNALSMILRTLGFFTVCTEPRMR